MGEESTNKPKKEKPKVINFSYIKDLDLKMQLGRKFGIRDAERTDMLAIQTEKEGLKDGEIGLYKLNPEKQKLEKIKKDGISITETSRGNDLCIMNDDGSVNFQDEISTMSFGGIKLSFFTDKNGKLNVTRTSAEKSILMETYSPEHDGNQKKSKPVEQIVEEKGSVATIQSLDMSKLKDVEAMRIIIRDRMRNREEKAKEAAQYMRNAGRMVSVADRLQAQNQDRYIRDNASARGDKYGRY